jgi:adenosylmethionine-8-amino-7-oxononanoate aminotransferase
MTIQERDRAAIWHPFTHSRNENRIIPIREARGVWLVDEDGRRYLDAISSWWVNLHGHANPFIARRIEAQMRTCEHVIFSGFTHAPAVELAEKLLEQMPWTDGNVFFSDDGSTAVEVAIKMALQYWYNRGESRHKIVVLKNGYHGDTFGAMSAGERSAFTRPFQSKLFDVIPIDISMEEHLPAAVETVHAHARETAAFLYEPLVQGAGGMLMYPASSLEKILRVCKAHNILAIADEIMTGMYRTGSFLSSDRIPTKPDMICLSKGLTGGFMPMAVTLCTKDVRNSFRSDESDRTFYHGHSYTGNPLGCAAALATLELLFTPSCLERIRSITDQHRLFALHLQKYPLVHHPRSTGTILAFEVAHATASYFDSLRDRLYHEFLTREVLLRPLGNTVYVMPPYCIRDDELQFVYDAILDTLAQLSP